MTKPNTAELLEDLSDLRLSIDDIAEFGKTFVGLDPELTAAVTRLLDHAAI